MIKSSPYKYKNGIRQKKITPDRCQTKISYETVTEQTYGVSVPLHPFYTGVEHAYWYDDDFVICMFHSENHKGCDVTGVNATLSLMQTEIRSGIGRVWNIYFCSDCLEKCIKRKLINFCKIISIPHYWVHLFVKNFLFKEKINNLRVFIRRQMQK